MSAAPGDPVDQPICSGVDNSGGRSVPDRILDAIRENLLLFPDVPLMVSRKPTRITYPDGTRFEFDSIYAGIHDIAADTLGLGSAAIIPLTKPVEIDGRE